MTVLLRVCAADTSLIHFLQLNIGETCMQNSMKCNQTLTESMQNKSLAQRCNLFFNLVMVYGHLRNILSKKVKFIKSGSSTSEVLTISGGYCIQK